MSTPDDDTDDETTYIATESIHGGGTLTYCITHPREQTAGTLRSSIQTALEATNARYWNDAPRRRVGPTRADTEYELREIRAAVDGINADPSFAKNVDGDVTYRIDEGYYPGEWTHYVDVTDLPVDQRARALLTAQSQLAQRGYVVNSMRSDDDDGHLEAFHVVSLRWLYSARAYGRRQATEGDDA